MSRTDEIVDLLLKNRFDGLSLEEEVRLEQWKNEDVANKECYQRTKDPSWEHMQIAYYNELDIDEGRARVHRKGTRNHSCGYNCYQLSLRSVL